MMSTARSRHQFVMSAVSLAFALGGCSLLNPYVRAPELDQAGTLGQKQPASGSSNHALTDAMAAAAAQRKAYYEAVGDRAKLRNGLPLVLVPLAGAALYKGLVDTGESTRRILLKEGVVGASIFGLGSYYTSSSRELTYLAGAKALSCSLYAMTPYVLPADLEARIDTPKAEELSQRLGAVRALMEPARQQAEIQSRLATTDADAKAGMATLLARAKSSIDAGDALLRRMVEMRAAFDDAGHRLAATVENIVSEVDAQIANTEPDPAAILTIINGLPGTAKQFAPGATFTAAKSDTSFGVNKGTEKLSELSTALNNLEETASTIRFGLDVVAQRIKTTPALDTCKVQLAQGTLDISPEEGAEMKVGETRQFVIRSTAGIPTVNWIGAVNANVDMSPPSLAGETLVVQVNYKAAVEGLSQVTFQAATKELRKQVTITLAAAAAAPAAQPAAAPPAAGASAPAAGAPPAGPQGPQNTFEKSLSADQLKALQKQLAVPQTGQFDAPTRAAIKKRQVEINQAPANGVLQRQAAMDALMK